MWANFVRKFVMHAHMAKTIIKRKIIDSNPVKKFKNTFATFYNVVSVGKTKKVRIIAKGGLPFTAGFI